MMRFENFQTENFQMLSDSVLGVESTILSLKLSLLSFILNHKEN